MRFRIPRLTCLAALGVLSCTSATAPEPEGQWGSTQASLQLQRSGGTITYQCGDGTIDSTWTVDGAGVFRATGQHFPGGGPEPIGGRTPQAATYSGQFRGRILTLRVTIMPGSVQLGPFTLVRGETGVGPVCL